MEIGTADEGLLPALAQRLPAGMTLYVAARDGAPLEDVVRVACSAQSLGFQASPHVVARRLASERALRGALQELTDAGVEQVLVIAGEDAVPSGKFASALELLETGAIVDAGIRRIAVAGFPQGHRVIGPARLLQALRAKQAFADATGTRVHIVTQFGFNPAAVCAWAAGLARAGVSLPVHAGIAGPMPLPRLIQLAMQHSPPGTLASLMTHLTAMSHRVQPATAPGEILAALERQCRLAACGNLVLPHFYSFGGAVTTASWLRAVMDGTVDLSHASPAGAAR